MVDGTGARWLLRATLGVLLLHAPNAFAQSDAATCLIELRVAAVASGIDGAAFDAIAGGLTVDPTVLTFSSSQPEVQWTTADYVRYIVDDQRIADGQKAMVDLQPTLANVKSQFGVPREFLAALWGIESDYGRAVGTRPVLQSLATLACGGARTTYFQNEFLTAVRIAASGAVRPENMVGSWAGAFGQLQFMPSSFVDDAIDVDGDGTIDLVHSMPDALGSAANKLVHDGWIAGIPWGYEVTVPAGFDASGASRTNKRPYTEWTQRGVMRVDGEALPLSGTAGMILPAGLDGPIFLTTANFDALYAYNPSESYALSVAYLSDRIAGRDPFVTPWPLPSLILSRAETTQLQQGLAARGFDPGPADGIAGARTRAAISAFESHVGRPATGEPTRALLETVGSAPGYRGRWWGAGFCAASSSCPKPTP